MVRVCSICKHKERSQIEQAILAGETYSSISKQWAVNDYAICNHKTHHMTELITQARAQATEQGKKTLLEKIQELSTQASQILADCPVDDTRARILALKEVREISLLPSKLLGELTPEGQYKPNQGPASIFASPEWLGLTQALVKRRRAPLQAAGHARRRR